MNVHDLTTIIRKADPSITVSGSRAILERLVDGIAAALVRGEKVRIAGFGNFAVAARPAREGRNPRTGDPVKIAAKRVPNFRPARALKDAVNPVRMVGSARNSPMPQRKRA